MEVSWLAGDSEEELRSALASVAPDLAASPVAMNARLDQPNPMYWSGSAVLDQRYVVKFAWAEAPARRLDVEGQVLRLLAETAPGVAVPRVVATSSRPALVVTELVAGYPLTAELSRPLSGDALAGVASQVATFLAALHAPAVLAHARARDIPMVPPWPQGDTDELRARLPRLLDGRRAHLAATWCDWVDVVLDDAGAPDVLVHGDFHGHNQVWDHRTLELRAVVDFESAGPGDPAFDFRYLPGYEAGFLRAVTNRYAEQAPPVDVERVMAWHVRTALGDVLWRTEGGFPLPDRGTPASWVDDLERRLGDVIGRTP